jgi:hypothetical protein
MRIVCGIAGLTQRVTENKVPAESCQVCGEPYYFANTMQHPEKLRAEFACR